MAKRKVTISMDEDAHANLERLAGSFTARSPFTISGLLNLAAGAMTHDDVLALVCEGDFDREVGPAADDRLRNLLEEHEREIRRRIGDYPRNLPEEDARQEVMQTVADDHQNEVRELITQITQRVQDDIAAEEQRK